MVLKQGINPKNTTQNPWLIPACFIPKRTPCIQVAVKSQILDPMMSVEKKTASTMDPTHPPKNQPNFNKILPFFTLFSNSRTLTY